MEKIIELYKGGVIASSMANSLYAASGLESHCGLSNDRTDIARKALISTLPRRSLKRRQEAAKMAERIGQELAKNIDTWSTWSNGADVIQTQIDRIAYYREMAKTGLDPMDKRDFNKLAKVLLEIRRLKNDGKRLKAIALAMAKELGFDSDVFLGAALSTPNDFKKWANSLLN